MFKKTFAVAALAAFSSIAPAQAATLSYSDGKALATTNWADTLSFAKFDTGLGTLTSIRFDLSGLMHGAGNAESMDAGPSKVTLSMGSLLGLTRPDNRTLVATNLAFSHIFDFTAFDGRIDFGGTSGGTTGAVWVGGSNFFVSTDASDFALFSAPGGGTIRLGLEAAGASNGSGSGNLVTQFNTAAAGAAKVTYEYTLTRTLVAKVPEPASLALMCGGLGLLGAARRKRKA